MADRSGVGRSPNAAGVSPRAQNPANSHAAAISARVLHQRRRDHQPGGPPEVTLPPAASTTPASST